MKALFRDIGTCSARLSVPRPPALRFDVALGVRFSHPDGSIPPLRLEGVVARAALDPR
jgi:hypothetical protein